MEVPHPNLLKDARELDKKLNEEMFHFHDALVLDVHLVVAKGFASISLLAYPIYESKDREPVVIWFEDVSVYASTLDLKEMKRNEFAGTVSSIRLQERDRTTKIFLSGGTILIRSKTPKLG